MNKLVLLDGNSLLNRAYFALPPLNDSDGNNVNAVYGFVNLMLSAISNYQPTHLVVAFDAGGRNFRKDIYSDYKANRKGMPDDLASQMPILINLLEAMSIKIVMRKGIEADDILGTIVTNIDTDSIIITGDRDMLQVVNDHTTVALTKRGLQDVELVTPSLLADNYHLTPAQVIDYKALRGDTSDNIPGVRGIGEKTAMSLLEQYSHLDEVYNNIDSIKGAVKDKLIANKELAYISRQLATIITNLDIDCELSQCLLPQYNDNVKQLMTHLKFRSIISRIDFVGEAHDSIIEQQPIDTIAVTTMEQLQQLTSRLNNCQEFAIDITNTSVDIATDNVTQYSIEVSDSFLDELTFDSVFSQLSQVLSSENISKVVFDNKTLRHSLLEYNIQLRGVKYDLALMQYLVLAKSVKNNTQLLDELGLINRVANMLVAKELLYNKLVEIDNVELYSAVELPLSGILFDMECQGVTIDTEQLASMSVQMREQLEQLADSIYSSVGEAFNIGSPKQLSVILFEKLALPHYKKTATGYSTSNDVLVKLQHQHEVIPMIMEYRQISKLHGTYVEGLKSLIINGKVHTTFNQYLTTTGRLSSSDPNLQNIPIRSENGRNIRKLFVPTNDIFVGADYSQIELRLLASFSQDTNLIEAFVNEQDIHSKVASELMGIPLPMVNSDMRRMAKAVNFGIIYGISDFGLSESTGLGISKAHKYIDLYFQRFPTIKSYLDSCVAQAKTNGYVTTIMGRRRYIPEINSSNYNLRGFGERAAMNMPLQGSAADIMKVAMIEVAKQLQLQNLHSKLVLQIHDEIIVDAVIGEVELVKTIINQAMVNAIQLNCPLVADVEVGESLYEV